MPSAPAAFITGITGFVGKYLGDHLISQGISVAGVDRVPLYEHPGITYFEGDILDTAALAHMLSSVRPRMIFHLAAISSPTDADSSPRLALDSNIMGSASLLEAARQACPHSRILLVGSSKQYSDRIVDGAITEDTPCRPSNFYGVSKFAAELIGLQYVLQYGVDVRFTRSFNHTGPSQSPRFVCSDWAQQAAEIEVGKREPCIRVGDLSPALDFTDVRDVVRAYHLILEKGTKGEIYNVCSGKAVPLGDILSGITNRTQTHITIQRDDTRLREHKTSVQVIGDRTKLTRETGWNPQIPLEKTLDDLYRYWLTRARATAT